MFGTGLSFKGMGRLGSGAGRMEESDAWGSSTMQLEVCTSDNATMPVSGKVRSCVLGSTE